MGAGDVLTIGADVASILGLFVTIGGFVIAIRQIQKSKSASEQARAAAESVRNHLSRFNAVRAITDAIGILKQIQNYQTRGAWEQVPELYGRIRDDLIRVKHKTPNLNDVLQSSMQAVVQQVTGLEELVARPTENANLDVRRMNVQITRQIHRLTEICVQLEGEIEAFRS